MKELKIDIPDGYEVECVKFKKIPETIIKWDILNFAVEVQDKGERFLVSAKPSMVMSWHDAVRFYKDNKVWQLPTYENLKLIAEHIDEVNALIKANGGYEIRGGHWTADKYDKFCAWYVNMSYGDTYYSNKYSNYYVRAIRNLNI